MDQVVTVVVLQAFGYLGLVRNYLEKIFLVNLIIFEFLAATEVVGNVFDALLKVELPLVLGFVFATLLLRRLLNRNSFLQVQGLQLLEVHLDIVVSPSKQKLFKVA